MFESRRGQLSLFATCSYHINIVIQFFSASYLTLLHPLPTLSLRMKSFQIRKNLEKDLKTFPTTVAMWLLSPRILCRNKKISKTIFSAGVSQRATSFLLKWIRIWLKSVLKRKTWQSWIQAVSSYLWSNWQLIETNWLLSVSSASTGDYTENIWTCQVLWDF